MNTEKTCRSCLEDQSSMITLYECCADIDESIPLCDIIRILARIEVNKEDGFPNKICNICYCELKRSWKFVSQLQDSDKTLRSIEVLDIKSTISDSYEEEYLENDCGISDTKPSIDKNVSEPSYISDHDYDGNCKIDIDDSFIERSDIKVEYNPEESEICTNSKEECKTKIICMVCDEMFTSKNKLKLHTQQVHEFEYKCEHCDKSFPGSTNLKVHMRAHLSKKEKLYSCTECNAAYAFEFQLTQHSFKHKDQKPYPCPKCEKGCVTAESLRRHLKVHDENRKKPKHACKFCNKIFLYPSFLAEHMKNHTGDKPFLCSQCGRGFRQQGSLRYHIRSHQKIRPYECDICNNSFVSQGILKVHMRRHTDERPYVCEICGKGFRQSSDCKMHQRTHYGLKLVECNICNKKMTSTGQLTIHMRMHTGEKPFACPHCLRRFSTRSVLTKHIRIHTGEKPFVCNICNKPFSQSSTLNTHKKIHTLTKEKDKKKGKSKPVIIVEIN